MSELYIQSPLNERIRQEIRTAQGAIPFQRFMERALYAPGLGYYEREPKRVGIDGDFYTSVWVPCWVNCWGVILEDSPPN